MTSPASVGAAPRPRGRTATFARNDALATALELFWRHGYEGVSVADLCEAIGIAPPSLYHAFGSKANLFREALRLYNVGNMTAEEVAAAPSARFAVEAVLKRGVEAVTSQGSPVGCMISSGMLMVAPENTGLADATRILRTEMRKALEQRIARDVKAGVLQKTIQPAALARFYSTVLQGLSVQAIDGATRSELEAVVSAALRAWPE